MNKVEDMEKRALISMNLAELHVSEYERGFANRTLKPKAGDSVELSNGGYADVVAVGEYFCCIKPWVKNPGSTAAEFQVISLRDIVKIVMNGKVARAVSAKKRQTTTTINWFKSIALHNTQEEEVSSDE